MPIDWSRLTRRPAEPEPTVLTPSPQYAHLAPPPLDPDRAAVLRITREDRDAAADRWPSPDEWRRGWPGRRQDLSEPSTLRPAPAWDGTDRGMCVYGGGR